MSYVVRQETFENLASEWQETLPRCPADSIFLTPRWQQVWWDEIDRGDLQLLGIREHSTLVGIAPLASEGSRWRFLGDASVFDYQDFIIPDDSRPHATGFFHTVFDYLDAQGWEVLDLASVREDSPTYTLLPRLARERGYGVYVEPEDVSPGVELPSNWDAYLSGLSKKDRHELRRKFRRLERSGSSTVTVVTDRERLPETMDTVLMLMRASHVDKSVFLTSERERYFRSMADAVADSGMLRIFFLNVDGTAVATAMCFDYRGRRFLYNSGYDPDYASLSVSLLLKAQCLREAIEQGMEYFDFLRGDEPYKYDLGGVDRSLYRLVVSRDPSGVAEA